MVVKTARFIGDHKHGKQSSSVLPQAAGLSSQSGVLIKTNDNINVYRKLCDFLYVCMRTGPT